MVKNDRAIRTECLAQLEHVEDRLDKLDNVRALPHLSMAIDLLRDDLGLPERIPNYDDGV